MSLQVPTAQVSFDSAKSISPGAQREEQELFDFAGAWQSVTSQREASPQQILDLPDIQVSPPPPPQLLLDQFRNILFRNQPWPSHFLAPEKPRGHLPSEEYQKRHILTAPHQAQEQLGLPFPPTADLN
ncbi:uncharacterized protein LOC144306424 [Canis aureus]